MHWMSLGNVHTRLHTKRQSGRYPNVTHLTLAGFPTLTHGEVSTPVKVSPTYALWSVTSDDAAHVSRAVDLYEVATVRPPDQ